MFKYNFKNLLQNPAGNFLNKTVQVISRGVIWGAMASVATVTYGLVTEHIFPFAKNSLEKIAANEEDKKEDKENLPLKTIDSSDEELIAACPQLKDVELIETNFDENPIPSVSNVFYLVSSIKAESDQSYAEGVAYQKFQQKIQESNTPDPIKIIVNSDGGNIATKDALEGYIKEYKGTLITHGRESASSAASVLLALGTQNYRYVNMGIETIIHGVKFVHDNKVAYDYPKESEERIELEGFNKKLREVYKTRSATGITDSCVDKLVTGDRKDVNLNSEDLLRLGFADYSIDWKNKIILSRADDTKYSVMLQPSSP